MKLNLLELEQHANETKGDKTTVGSATNKNNSASTTNTSPRPNQRNGGLFSSCQGEDGNFNICGGNQQKYVYDAKAAEQSR